MASLKQKLHLLLGLLTGDFVRTGPFYATVDITRRCNFQCPECQYHSPFRDKAQQEVSEVSDVPLPRFEKLCRELKSMETQQMVLTGEGEPLLHPQLFELISIAKQMGFHLILFTNGLLLNDEKARALMDSGLDVLKLSLWASSPEEYQANYPEAKPENFAKTIAALKLLHTLKTNNNMSYPEVVLHQPVTKQNYENIDLRIALAKEIGAGTLSFSPVWSWRESSSLSAEEVEELCTSLIDMKARLKRHRLKHNINQALRRYEIGEAVWAKLPCYIAWYHARFRVSGAVLPCQRCDVVLGNLNETDFTEIWSGPAYRQFRRDVMTRDGLVSMKDHCDCRFCCYTLDNLSVHRIFRWIAPWRRWNKD